MKISSSSPSSSLSSSHSCYSSCTNAHSQNSSNSPATSCIPNILRRLVCGNNLYIQASNCTEEADGFVGLPSQDHKHQEKIHGSSSPGLVARLMGLESMPEFPRTFPNSISRSRSVNSFNSWAEIHSSHRGIRASMSFREVPTFLRQENQEFLVLSFGSGGGGESDMVGPKELKTELGLGELKERRVDRQKGKPKDGQREKVNNHCRSKVSEMRNRDKPSQRARDCSEIKGAAEPYKKEIYRKQRSVSRGEISRKRIDHKEISDGVKPVTKKKNKKKGDSAVKKVESECSSENSSPVSVLDRPFDIDADILMDSENLTSEKLRLSPSSARRKLSSRAVNFEPPPSHISCISILGDTKLNSPGDEVDLSWRMAQKSSCGYELWQEICKLAEEDVKNSNWVTRNGSKTEEIQEIEIEFAVHILDCILQEAMDELGELPQH